MPAGIQIRDAAGNVIVNVDTRLSRILGRVDVTNSGSLVEPGFATGTPWFLAIPLGSSFTWRAPAITFSGTTMSWVMTAGSQFRILYGVY